MVYQTGGRISRLETAWWPIECDRYLVISTASTNTLGTACLGTAVFETHCHVTY